MRVRARERTEKQCISDTGSLSSTPRALCSTGSSSTIWRARPPRHRLKIDWRRFRAR
jgi:hypothetical protein